MSWGKGPSSSARNADNNARKCHLPAGIGDNQQGPRGGGNPMTLGGFWHGAWAHTSEKEGVTPLEVDDVPPWDRITPGPRRRSPRTWWPRRSDGPRAQYRNLVHGREAWRAMDQSHSGRGVCAPTLKLPRWDAGFKGKGARYGPCQARQPDSGNPTVRDDNGGPGKRDLQCSLHHSRVCGLVLCTKKGARAPVLSRLRRVG